MHAISIFRIFLQILLGGLDASLGALSALGCSVIRGAHVVLDSVVFHECKKAAQVNCDPLSDTMTLGMQRSPKMLRSVSMVVAAVEVFITLSSGHFDVESTRTNSIFPLIGPAWFA